MKNKLAIVTGSSKGIGAGIVNELLADKDWDVLGISRSSNNLASQNQNYSEVLCDLMEEASIAKIKSEIERVASKYQIISFVHNFGLTAHSSVLNTDEQTWESVFKANVTIPFLFTKEISPLMKKGSSHIFIGSTLSTMAVPNSCAYVSSKHAVAGLMKATAIDLAAQGIRSNLVCPGFTETNMADQVVLNSANSAGMDQKGLKSSLEKMSPLKRFLTPEEIGKFVVYLANNPTINGEILHINGGFGLLK